MKRGAWECNAGSRGLGITEWCTQGEHQSETTETLRPPYRDPVLHFHAPRLIALRGGDRDEETSKTEKKDDFLMRRARARALSPRSFLLLEHSLQPTPSPLCGLASWPLLGACSMYPGERFPT